MDDWELAQERANLAALKMAELRGEHVTLAEREKAVEDAKVKRLSASTFIKHGRFMNKIGKMLHDMQLIDKNPFAVCVWTAEEEKALQMMHGYRPRIVWSDRIHDLFRLPVFQRDVDDPGDPLFWMRLIGRFQVFRSKEALQLGPDDLGTEGGAPYFEIHTEGLNSVKTESGVRGMPVHPRVRPAWLDEARRSAPQARPTASLPPCRT